MTFPFIVILTGAGISRESGLATFRDADGVWAKVRLEDVATPEAFAREPSLVHGFYNARRAQLRDASVAPMPRIAPWRSWMRAGRASCCSSPRMWMTCMTAPAPAGLCTCMGS